MSSVYQDYGLLLKQFLQGEMSAEEFQIAYLHQFKNESRQFDEALFEVLDTLFGDVDAFCADPDKRAELDAQIPGFYLDESELRQRVAHASEQLAALQQDALRETSTNDD
jgi:hypothetical protein